MSVEYNAEILAAYKPSLTVIRGDGPRKCAPRAPQRVNGPALEAVRLLRRIEQAWLANLRVLEIRVERLPFIFPADDPGRILWLRESHQALLLASYETPPVMAIARDLHTRIGAHKFAPSPGDDVRVIVSSTPGWFAGFCTEGGFRKLTDLNLCCACASYWFASRSASLCCRICGHDGSDGIPVIAAAFTNELPALGRAA